ncbi:MAG: ROK family protein [Burkholderiales bacterium]|jgi:glucokinase|nr:ROK family protein [Burkholderiales bacterium]
MTSKVIGIDLGASNIRAGLVVNGKIIRYTKAKLPTNKTYQNVLDLIFQCIDEIIEPEVVAIGIGVPSIVERNSGIVYNVQNIPQWQEVPLKDILQQRYSCQVAVNNDANCFALGEYLYGTGKNYTNFIGITIGTGVGGGIINNGKLLIDVNCGSGEFGEMLYLDSKYENYCSGMFFTLKYSTTAEEVFHQAQNGNTDAIAICNEFGHHLGKLIYSIVAAFDPEVILLGGSIASGYALYQSAIYEELAKFPYPLIINRLKIICTATADIQILGAAALYFNNNH